MSFRANDDGEEDGGVMVIVMVEIMIIVIEMMINVMTVLLIIHLISLHKYPEQGHRRNEA